MRSRRLRAGIIGVGKRAKDYYIPELSKSEMYEIVSACDSSEERLKTKRLAGVTKFSDYELMIEESKLDVVIAATPHHLHSDIVKKSAVNEVHVIKEKPLAASISDANDIASIYEQEEIHVITAVQRRFDPVYNYFKKSLGDIGKPFHIEGKYTIFVDNLNKGWRSKKDKSGGGCLIDMGYHIIDLIIWYFGLPYRVYAKNTSYAEEDKEYCVEDTSTVMVEYESGLNGVVNISRRSAPKREYLEVVGSKGVCRLERDMIKKYDGEGHIEYELARSDLESSSHTKQIDEFGKILLGDSGKYENPKSQMRHMKFLNACYRSDESAQFEEIKD